MPNGNCGKCKQRFFELYKDGFCAECYVLYPPRALRLVPSTCNGITTAHLEEV